MNSSNMLRSAVVRVSSAGGYCTGVLLGEHTVLTARHFVRGKTQVTLRGEAWVRKSNHWLPVPGTDSALVFLRTPVTVQAPVVIAARMPRIGASTLQFGFGGASTSKIMPGRIWMRVPVAVSKDFRTRMVHAALVRSTPPAVRGDSGGPIFVDGQLVGLQSLIWDPLRVNLGVATVTLLSPYRTRIQELTGLFTQ